MPITILTTFLAPSVTREIWLGSSSKDARSVNENRKRNPSTFSVQDCKVNKKHRLQLAADQDVPSFGKGPGTSLSGLHKVHPSGLAEGSLATYTSVWLPSTSSLCPYRLPHRQDVVELFEYGIPTVPDGEPEEEGPATLSKLGWPIHGSGLDP